MPYRSFVAATHTVDEMKAMAEENEYDTEPNDEGEIEKRPGKISDYLIPPYKNDEAARAANNGALPPDLSLMVKARHGGCNYIFSLLTGYPEEPPPGATVQSGLNFNPYFPGTGMSISHLFLYPTNPHLLSTTLYLPQLKTSHRYSNGPCPLRRPRRIRRRHPRHHLPNGQRRRRVPQLHRRTRNGYPQEDGLGHRHHHICAVGVEYLGEEV